MPPVEREKILLETLDELHAWLALNHATSPGIWLVSWRTSTGRPAIPYEAIVEECLCWGWIDGQTKLLDDERGMLRLAPRSPRSGWARTNKLRLERLAAAGRIQPAGQRAIDVAMANGTWSILDDAENGVVPDDLAAALAANPPAARNWERFPPSARKAAVGALALTKRPDTRARKIAAYVRLAAENKRPVG